MRAMTTTALALVVLATATGAAGQDRTWLERQYAEIESQRRAARQRLTPSEFDDRIAVFALPTEDRAELVYLLTNATECAALRGRLTVWRELPPHAGWGGRFGVELVSRFGRAHVVVYGFNGIVAKAFRRFSTTAAVEEACRWFADIGHEQRGER